MCCFLMSSRIYSNNWPHWTLWSFSMGSRLKRWRCWARSWKMSIWAPSSPVARHGRRPSPVAWTWDDGNAWKCQAQNRGKWGIQVYPLLMASLSGTMINKLFFGVFPCFPYIFRFQSYSLTSQGMCLEHRVTGPSADYDRNVAMALAGEMFTSRCSIKSDGDPTRWCPPPVISWLINHRSIV